MTYTIKVQNLGQAAASSAATTLTITLPSGLTSISLTAPADWTCAITIPINCTLPGSLAWGSTDTITITAHDSFRSYYAQRHCRAFSRRRPQSRPTTTLPPTPLSSPSSAPPPAKTVRAALSPALSTPTIRLHPQALLPPVPLPLRWVPPPRWALRKPSPPVICCSSSRCRTLPSTVRNTSSYGDGVPGDPGSGSTSLGSSGLFEFVTATNAVPVTGGTLQFTGTGPGGGLLNSYSYAIATATQGQQTYQVIRVPQYTSATLSSTLAPLAWNGSVGGVLAIDVSSQLTLGGTVAADALGFRGGGGITLTGTTNAVSDTDYVTSSPANLPNLTGGGDAPANSGTNASKGEGIAGTPHWVAPALGSITTTSTALSTNQTVLEGLPSGSFARGAPGNAGGGGTDGDPANNDYNSGGGAGGNGGTGGQGGYGWNSMAVTNSTDGGFGGVAFPASTSALVMGGGGGAGTTNNGTYYIPSNGTHGADCGLNCTGIYSSGGAGGGIVIVHAGSVTGTGTITSNGQSTLSTYNDSTGGAGAGGSILFFANSGGLSGLTVSAIGGNGGNAWPTQAPGGFPGQRHGPGGGGGGGVIFLSASPASSSVAGGSNGYTDTVEDSYGAIPGQAGLVVTTDVITETPGTQSGAYCASADLSVTNFATPLVVLPGGTITYTQTVTNNGPLDAVNAVFTENTPANTTFSSIIIPAGWTCTTPAVGASGAISCNTTSGIFPANTSGTFNVVVTVAGTTPAARKSWMSPTSPPAPPTPISPTTLPLPSPPSASRELRILPLPTPLPPPPSLLARMSRSRASSPIKDPPLPPAPFSPRPFPLTLPFNPSPLLRAGAAITQPSAARRAPSSALTILSSGSIPPPLSPSSSTSPAPPRPAHVITATDNVFSATPDPNYSNNSASTTFTVATAGQADLAVTASASPNPVTQGNNITFTGTVTNNGPATETNATFTVTIPANTTFYSLTPVPSGWTCNTPAVGGTGTFTCTLTTSLAAGANVSFPLVVKVNSGVAGGTTISATPSVSSTVGDPNSSNNSATATTIVASPTQSSVTATKTASPDPVNQGSTLTYTLTVINSGPAVAQNVTVTDPLPAEVTYIPNSYSTTMGSCSGTTTVTCTLGNLAVGSTAVITINVTATTFSAASLSTNTATITSSTAALTSNIPSYPFTASFVSTIQAPTAVDISSFQAFSQSDGSVILEWRTHEESRNLGFHIYREDASGRTRLDPSLIAGSALLLRGSRPQHAAKIYRWIDPQPCSRCRVLD